MTRLRRQRPSARHARSYALIAAAFTAVLWHAAPAASDEQNVADRNSGLAIQGFDPVSYFNEGRALAGQVELELDLGGVAWRFRSEGNRAAFADRPEAYAPRYGGNDPVAAGRGVVRPGNPDHWAIHDKKLYLFDSEETKVEFELNPKVAISLAEANWPLVSDMPAP
jgi:YHS domain-containing protein